jgi:hypothetical protein
MKTEKKVLLPVTLAAGGIGITSLRMRRRRAIPAPDVAQAAAPPAEAEHVDEGTAEAGDPAHAPGHRHLGPPPAAARSGRRWRPWPPRGDRTGHPGTFSGDVHTFPETSRRLPR